MDINISVRDYTGARDDVSFIDDIDWETPEHLRVATEIWLSSRLAAVSGVDISPRTKSMATADGLIEQVQMRLAANPQSPPAVLQYIAKNASHMVLERIGEHPKTPAGVLRELAQHQASAVRQAIADNANTPKDVFEILMKDEDVDVRYRLAENPLLPMDLLTRLCVDDSHPYVAARASTTMARLSCGRVFLGGFTARGGRWRRGNAASG